MDIEFIKSFVARKRTEMELLENQLAHSQAMTSSFQKLVLELTEARQVIMAVSKSTQEQFKDYVESLVTTAIQSVFPEKGYHFIVESDVKSNRTEINLLVQQGEKEPYVPKEEQGGALLDTISFALKVVLWSLEQPRSRNVLFYDEPFRFTGALTELAAAMMKEVSHELSLQIILVTHDNRLEQIADKAWRVSREDGEHSVVEEIRKEENPRCILLRRKK